MCEFTQGQIAASGLCTCHHVGSLTSVKRFGGKCMCYHTNHTLKRLCKLRTTVMIIVDTERSVGHFMHNKLKKVNNLIDDKKRHT